MGALVSTPRISPGTSGTCVKPVAFGRRKADEPREAKQAGSGGFARGTSEKDQTPWRT